MTKQTFQEFLDNEFMDHEPGILDDDLTEKCDEWLGELQVDDWLELGEKYGKYLTE